MWLWFLFPNRNCFCSSVCTFSSLVWHFSSAGPQGSEAPGPAVLRITYRLAPLSMSVLSLILSPGTGFAPVSIGTPVAPHGALCIQILLMLKARELKACTPWAEMARKGKKRRAPAEKRKAGLALFLWVLTIEAFLYELQCPGTDMLLPDELDAADEAYIDVWTVLPNHVVASEGQPPSLFGRVEPSDEDGEDSQ